jgi:hypothetical protein
MEPATLSDSLRGIQHERQPMLVMSNSPKLSISVPIPMTCFTAMTLRSDYNPAPDLEKIKAKLLLVDFEDDQVNAPEFSVLDREMPRVKNGRYVIVPVGKLSEGEGNNIRNAELWKTYLEEFLRSLTH